MSALPTTAQGDQPRPLRIVIAEAGSILAITYPEYAFVLVGHHPSGDARFEVRLPVPGTGSPVAPATPEEGSNADLIMTVVEEADGPMTGREIAYKAIGAEPSGAFKRALRSLVNAGRLRELPGPPKAYDLP